MARAGSQTAVQGVKQQCREQRGESGRTPVCFLLPQSLRAETQVGAVREAMERQRQMGSTRVSEVGKLRQGAGPWMVKRPAPGFLSCLLVSPWSQAGTVGLCWPALPETPGPLR